MHTRSIPTRPTLDAVSLRELETARRGQFSGIGIDLSTAQSEGALRIVQRHCGFARRASSTRNLPLHAHATRSPIKADRRLDQWRLGFGIRS